MEASEIDRSSLWGDILKPKTFPRITLSNSDREMLTRLPRPLQIEGPRIHQPSTTTSDQPHISKIISERTQDPYVINGIKLQNFLRETSENNSEKKFPELEPFYSSSPKRSEPFGYLIRKETNFTRGVGPQVTTFLSRPAALKILHKSVASVSAFAGYETATEEALDILTDVTGDYIRNFCQQLRVAHDRSCIDGTTGFPDIVERVCNDMNVGSVLNLQRYYEKNVVHYYKYLLEESKKFTTTASFVSQPAEIIMGDDDIPEIHFPSSEEGPDHHDHSTPQLETGLQMLQSLEQADHGTNGPQSVDEPLSHDSNSALLLATVSPGSANNRKRRKTSDRSFIN